MSPFGWSLTVWGIYIIVGFGTLEGLALADLVPWNSLSWTLWQLSARNAVFTLIFAAILFDGLMHIILPGHWPRAQQKRERTEGKR